MELCTDYSASITNDEWRAGTIGIREGDVVRRKSEVVCDIEYACAKGKRTPSARFDLPCNGECNGAEGQRQQGEQSSEHD